MSALLPFCACQGKTAFKLAAKSTQDQGCVALCSDALCTGKWGGGG